MPPMRHWRKNHPAVSFQIIALLLTERMIGRQLATKHQDEAVIIRTRKPTARRRQWCGRCPSLRCRIVHIVHGRTCQRALKPTANRMDFSIDGDNHHVITRRWQCRGIAPFAGLRIIHFVSRDGHAIGAAPANDVDLPVDYSGTCGAARNLICGSANLKRMEFVLPGARYSIW